MKTLKERIEIEQAFLDGKQIQYRYLLRGGWHHAPIYDAKDDDNFLFHWMSYDYRIKAEPRVVYVNEYHYGLGRSVFRTLEEAMNGAREDYRRTQRFVEDLDYREKQ